MKILATYFLLLLIPFDFGSNPLINDGLNTAKNAGYLSPMEKEIIFEINLFRSDPSKYAKEYIAPLAKHYRKEILYYPGDKPVKTVEGVKALYECIRALKSAKPLSVLQPSKALSMAASDHQKDQSQSGKTGHFGSDRSNFKQRIERYGKWQKRIAENISYGNTSARQVIIFLLIDDNVVNRGHRLNLLHPDFNTIGVSFGSHPVYSTMCVMDFAGGFKGKQEL